MARYIDDVPSTRDDPRHSTDADRASCMIPIDCSPLTLAERRNSGDIQIGSASDHAGTTSAAQRRSVGQNDD